MADAPTSASAEMDKFLKWIMLQVKWKSGALSAPGDTTMAILPEVEKVMKGVSARVATRRITTPGAKQMHH